MLNAPIIKCNFGFVEKIMKSKIHHLQQIHLQHQNHMAQLHRIHHCDMFLDKGIYS